MRAQAIFPRAARGEAKRLIRLSRNRQAMAQEKIAVIGLGYVGIPLCALLADKGFDVVGIDVIKERAEAVNAGSLPLKGEEPGLAGLLAKAVKKGKLRATTSFGSCKDRTAIFVCVDTPIDADRKPEYSRLES